MPTSEHDGRTKSTRRFAALRTRDGQAHFEAGAACLAEAATSLSGMRGQRLADLARRASLAAESLNGIVADLLRPRGDLS